MVFERQRSGPPIKAASILSVVYLVPATVYYSFLVLLYSHWTNQAVVVSWIVVLGCFAPPLLALWKAVLVGLRSKSVPEAIALSRPVRMALGLGACEVVLLALYGGSHYFAGPFTESHFTAAFVALCYSPAALAAVFYLWASHDERRAG